MEAQRIAAIVLAAGGSRRMGSPKMLEQLEGKPLVAHAVDASLESRADAVFVVTGCAGDDVRSALDDSDLRFVDNPDWTEGLASSIRSGVDALGGFDAALILLGDQPSVTAELIDALIERFHTGQALAACEYPDGTIGPPVLFGRAHYPALRALTGDQGAKTLLRAAEPAIVRFPTGNLDIDTPKDLEQARLRATRTS